MNMPSELLDLIKSGEGIHVEFKTSTADLTEDVCETVCAFLNRDGGHIFFGVEEDREITGIDPDLADRIMEDFTAAVSNSNQIYPPLNVFTITIPI